MSMLVLSRKPEQKEKMWDRQGGACKALSDY
jgi:hypothetical protein